jgi:DNA-binding transcriptional MerR regulator
MRAEADGDRGAQVGQRLTIEELAAATGLTVRNIREHQTRGLLPPPEMQGRKGSYDHRHVARLRFVQQLQSEGLNLQAISWLLQRAPAEAADEVVRFEQALFAPWGNDTTVQWTTAELAARLGPVEPERLQRAVELEVLRPAGPDTWEILSARLVDAGADLYRLGIPLDAALDVVEELREHTGAVARAFVKLFVDHVWEPFDQQGHPVEQWEDVAHALERLRPIATHALLAVFHQSMGTTVEQAAAAIGVQREQDSA